MTDRNYFVEDAKNSRIVFTGTKEECDEWIDDIWKSTRIRF